MDLDLWHFFEEEMEILTPGGQRGIGNFINVRMDGPSLGSLRLGPQFLRIPHFEFPSLQNANTLNGRWIGELTNFPRPIQERRNTDTRRRGSYRARGARYPSRANQRKIEGLTVRFKYEKIARHLEEHGRLEGEELEGHVDRCTICYNDFEENDDVRRLPCLHLFHVSCIDEWLKTTQNCPICRISIDSRLETGPPFSLPHL